MIDLLKYLDARLKEASTWATIAALLAAAHLSIDGALWQEISTWGLIGAGALGIVLVERGSKTPAEIARDVLAQELPAVLAQTSASQTSSTQTATSTTAQS